MQRYINELNSVFHENMKCWYTPSLSAGAGETKGQHFEGGDNEHTDQRTN